MATTSVTDRVERLNRVSERRVIDPDRDLPGCIGEGQLVPDELLSVHGTGIALDAEQRRRLSREEVASMFDAGIRFEAVLEAGFALQVAREIADGPTGARALRGQEARGAGELGSELERRAHHGARPPDRRCCSSSSGCASKVRRRSRGRLS